MEGFKYFLTWYAENPCLGLPILFIVLVLVLMIGEMVTLPIKGILKISDDESEE